MNDPRDRADHTAERTRAALERNARVFAPVAEAMAETVRRGGRLLLLGEGPLQHLARYAAVEIVGRRHQSGVQLPADALDLALGEPHAIARRIGPFDAVLAIAGRCDDGLFTGTLEAARSRGAKILAVCVAPARLEGRADLAVDVPEPRPHHVPGLAAMILHFLAKLALARLAANPLVRPQRLDDGPPRGGAPREGRGVSREPSSGRIDKVPPTEAPPVALAPAASVLPVLEAEDEATATIQIPTDGLEIDFFEGVAESARRAGAPSPADSSAPAEPAAPAARPPEGGISLITFRCKQCRAALNAEAAEAGNRALCPFCGRKVKVPRASGRVYPRRTEAPGRPALPLPEPKRTAPLRPEKRPTSRDPEAEEAPAAPAAEGAAPAGAARAREPERLEAEFEVDPVPATAAAPAAAAAAPPPLPAGPARTAPDIRGDSGEIMALALEAVSQPPRPVSLRFRLEDCRIELTPEAGPPSPGHVCDITPDGLEVLLAAPDLAQFAKGARVELRLETPAFLDPLIARTTVEQVIVEPGTPAVRVLLPLDPDAPRDAREKLARLADLAEARGLGT